jgi:hypothetical protein
MKKKIQSEEEKRSDAVMCVSLRFFRVCGACFLGGE